MKSHPLLHGPKMARDPSTEAIKAKLATPRSRNVVEAHGGIASVATNSGKKPRMHGTAGNNAASNAATNAGLADAGRNSAQATDAGAVSRSRYHHQTVIGGSLGISNRTEKGSTDRQDEST